MESGIWNFKKFQKLKIFFKCCLTVFNSCLTVFNILKTVFGNRSNEKKSENRFFTVNFRLIFGAYSTENGPTKLNGPRGLKTQGPGGVLSKLKFFLFILWV